MTSRPEATDPTMAEVQALRQQAAALEAKARRERKEREAKERAEAEAVRALEALAARTFRQPLDAVLAELRKALPGCETWHARVVEASRAYERAAEPLLARAGIARGSRFGLDRMMQAHPLLPLLPWLALLRGGPYRRAERQRGRRRVVALRGGELLLNRGLRKQPPCPRKG